MAQKDPAFLFYSRDFYEGTRMMLPDERACYIDLMIYQHQHGFIPVDIRRMCLYCSGISEETIKSVLESKFTLSENGWYNETMKKVIDERSEFSKHQSVNGTVGQFFKKAKAILSKKEYIQLRDILHNKTNDEVYTIIENKSIDEAMLKAMLAAKLKHLEDEDANTDSLVLEEEEEEREKSKFDIFNDWLKTNYPNVSKLEQQMTEKELNTIIEKYGREKLSLALEQMENYKILNKKYLSVYRTLITFIKNIK